jgi:hypothetical protein
MMRYVAAFLAMLFTLSWPPLVPKAAVATSSDWEAVGVDRPVSRVVVAGEVVYALVPAEGETPSALWRGDQSGTLWGEVAEPSLRLVDLAVHPSDARVVFVAGSGGIYRSTDGAMTWVNVLTGEGAQGGLRVVASAADPTLMYAATSSGSDATLWRSRDGGESWEQIRHLMGSLCSWSFPLIAPDPAVRERVYFSYACQAGRTTSATLRVSEDLWETERTILQPTPRGGELLTNLYPHDVWFEPDGVKGILVANRDARQGGSIVLGTVDGGESWAGQLEYPSRILSSDFSPGMEIMLSGLVVDQGGRAYVGRGRGGRGVLGSADGGASWHEVGNQPIGRVAALAHDPYQDVLYAATDRGLWRLASPHVETPNLVGPTIGPWNGVFLPALGGGNGEGRTSLGPLEIPADADPLELHLDAPGPLTPEPDGSLLVADSTYALTRLSPQHGGVARVPIDASFTPGAFRDVVGLAASTDGWLVYTAQDRVQAVTPWGETVHLAGQSGGAIELRDGAIAREVRLAQPAGVVVDDATGAVYVADSGNHVVRRIDPDGLIYSVAGTGRAGWGGDGRTATDTDLDQPWALIFDPERRLLIADRAGQRVVRLEADGTLLTVAGTGLQGYAGDGGPATAARLAFPSALAIDEASRIYIADTLNGSVRVVDVDGRIWTVGAPPGAGSLQRPIALAFGEGALYVADLASSRVLRFTAG